MLKLIVWYNIATALVLASYQEAFGAVTNEALLAGCYVLVSKKAGSACLVEPGVNGYTFNPMNEEELVVAMKKVRDCPITYDRDGLKKNLMWISYRSCLKRLITHLNQLAHE